MLDLDTLFLIKTRRLPYWMGLCTTVRRGTLHRILPLSHVT